MKLVIDRFEGDFAVCEKDDKTFINIEKNKLPLDTKESDIIYINDETNEISILKEETKKEKEELNELLKNLWK